MATFYNQATLSYNNNTTTSNITTGELVEVLSATKAAVVGSYVANDSVTYVISIINTGSAPFTSLTVADNLGSYVAGAATVTPLTYVNGSIQYYVNGTLQPAPVVTADAALTISGINVPANGNVILIYEVHVNQYAPLASESYITNTAVISGPGISNDIVVTESITTEDIAVLGISKSISPTTVSENGQLTYTFVIQNTGNVAATALDNVVVTDTFNPVLNNITVTFNGVTWTAPENYTYNTTTGAFATIAGAITVPAATYTQSADGSWVVNPGVSILTVTGTV